MYSRSTKPYLFFAVFIIAVVQLSTANIIVNTKNGEFIEMEGYQIFYKGKTCYRPRQKRLQNARDCFHIDFI